MARRSTFANRVQLCFAVRQGANGFLHLARQTFNRLTESVQELAHTYRAEHGLDGLKARSRQPAGGWGGGGIRVSHCDWYNMYCTDCRCWVPHITSCAV